MDPLHAAVGVLGTETNPWELSDSEDDKEFREKAANKNKRLQDKKKHKKKHKKKKRYREENPGAEQQERQRAKARRVAELKKWFEEGKGKCAITREPMVDPVRTVDGHVYERHAINTWFDKGMQTSPKTNCALESMELTPDTELREQIREYMNTLPKKNHPAYWKAIKEATAEFQLKQMRTVHPFELDKYYEAYTSNDGSMNDGSMNNYTVKFSITSDTNKLVLQCVPYVHTSSREYDHDKEQFTPVTSFSDDNLRWIRDDHGAETVPLTTVVDPLINAFSRRKPKVLYVYRCARTATENLPLPLILNGSLPCTKMTLKFKKRCC